MSDDPRDPYCFHDALHFALRTVAWLHDQGCDFCRRSWLLRQLMLADADDYKQRHR